MGVPTGKCSSCARSLESLLPVSPFCKGNAETQENPPDDLILCCPRTPPSRPPEGDSYGLRVIVKILRFARGELRLRIVSGSCGGLFGPQKAQPFSESGVTLEPWAPPPRPLGPYATSGSATPGGRREPPRRRPEDPLTGPITWAPSPGPDRRGSGRQAFTLGAQRRTGRATVRGPFWLPNWLSCSP